MISSCNFVFGARLNALLILLVRCRVQSISRAQSTEQHCVLTADHPTAHLSIVFESSSRMFCTTNRYLHASRTAAVGLWVCGWVWGLGAVELHACDGNGGRGRVVDVTLVPALLQHRPHLVLPPTRAHLVAAGPAAGQRHCWNWRQSPEGRSDRSLSPGMGGFS